MTYNFRRSVRLRDLACLLLVTLTACSGDKGPSDGDAAAPAAAGNPNLESDLEEVQDFKLSMPRMQKWAQAGRNLEALSKTRPDLEGSFKMESNASLDQQVAAMEAHPEVKKAVADADLSPREFMMITTAYMVAATAQSVGQMPAGKTRDSLMESLKTNPDNVAFIQKNMGELEKLMKGMQGN